MEFNKRKRDGSDVSSDEPSAKRLTKNQSLKLVDLNEDVLEKIFSNLDTQDLVNVVNSDKALWNVCSRTFQQKYRTECIDLPLERRVFNDTMEQSKISRNSELLRYFGKNILKLRINIDADDPIDRRIFHLIVTCCSETLIELNILCRTGELTINKSFMKLKTLRLVHECPVSMGDLRWFPLLEHLVFDCVDNATRIFKMGRKIASLKCLTLDFPKKNYEGRSFHIDDLHKFMQSNPQLSVLCLTLIPTIIGTNERRHLPRFHDKIIPDKLMTLKLSIPFKEYSSILANLKIPNDRIANLEIAARVVTPQICSYIKECVNLRTLKVGSKVILENLFEDAGWIDSTKHQNLTRLSFAIVFAQRSDDEWYSNILLNAIQPFVTQCKSLIRIKVYYYLPSYLRSYDPIFDYIRSRIDLKFWLFTREVSPNKLRASEIYRDVISFTLSKIAA